MKVRPLAADNDWVNPLSQRAHRLRRTPLTAIAVLIASLGAVLLTPSLLDTHRYYQGVLGSEAAVGHEGL